MAMATDGPHHRPCLLATLLVALLLALAPATARAETLWPGGPSPLWTDAQPAELTVHTTVGVTAGSLVVDYGPTASYGRSATLDVLPFEPDTATTLGTARLTGLQPDTVYHWRVRHTLLGLVTDDQTARTSPSGAPSLTAGPTAGYTGTGPTLTCSPGAWNDAKAALSYQWANDTGSGGSPVSVGGQTLTYSEPGRYRCTVTARNAAGASAASVVISASGDRIPLRIASYPSVRLLPADDSAPRRAACVGATFTGGAGAIVTTYRWWRNGTATVGGPEFELGPYTPGAGLSCEVEQARGTQSVRAMSGPYFGDEAGLKPVPPPPGSTPATATASVAAAPAAGRPVVTSSGDVLTLGSDAVAPGDDLTLDQARGYVRQALAEEFGRRYVKRRAFRMSCVQKTKARIRCKVQWHNDGLYKGEVVVVVPRDPEAAITISVEVSRPKRRLKQGWARTGRQLAAITGG
jgi:hypothetical protein